MNILEAAVIFPVRTEEVGIECDSRGSVIRQKIGYTSYTDRLRREGVTFFHPPPDGGISPDYDYLYLSLKITYRVV